MCRYTLPYPTLYRTDLAPSDYFLFLQLKKHLKGNLLSCSPMVPGAMNSSQTASSDLGSSRPRWSTLKYKILDVQLSVYLTKRNLLFSPPSYIRVSLFLSLSLSLSLSIRLLSMYLSTYLSVFSLSSSPLSFFLFFFVLFRTLSLSLPQYLTTSPFSLILLSPSFSFSLSLYLSLSFSTLQTSRSQYLICFNHIELNFISVQIAK